MLTAVLVASLCTTHVANYPTSHVSVAGPMCVGDFIAPADADSTSGSSQIMKDQATIILQTPAPAPARPPAVPAPQVRLAVPDTPQAVPDATPSKVNPDGLYYPQNYVKLGGQIEQKTVEKQVAEAAPKPVKNFFRARKVHHRYHYRHRVHRSSHAPSQFVTRPKSRGGFWWWEKRKH